MDEAIFRTKLDQLREGKLVLAAPGQNEIGKHARKHLPDLMEYNAAIEAGYRTLTGKLGAYRSVANERALRRIVKNQWSSPAALGYAAAALRQSGMNPSQVIGIMELMEGLMEEFPRAWAEGVYEEMIEDPGRERGTDCHGAPPLAMTDEGDGRPGDPAGDADSSTPLRSAQNDYEGAGEDGFFASLRMTEAGGQGSGHPTEGSKT